MSKFFARGTNCTQGFSLGMLILTTATLSLATGATGQELPMPPVGPAPRVESIEALPQVRPSFESGEEEQAPPTARPPLEDIPPMPMPYPSDDDALSLASEDPGAPIFRDLTTGEVTTGPAAEAAVSEGSAQGGYYPSADGGPGDGELAPASFGTKLLINDVGIAPWRMNVKVFMRFGNSWFVCSGAMRDIRTVQTAGHCVHEGNGGSWADEVLVYPGWDGSGTDPDAQTHGEARGVQLGSWTGWTDNGDFDFDWGVIALDRAVGALTGWYGWQTGDSCPTATYNVGSYPAESCSATLHNGSDQYYWWGTIDSCPDSQLQINTTTGCLTALWGGESGSNLYEESGDSRFTRGIASTSNRTTIANYVETTSTWVDFLNTTFIPDSARGSTFDLQALDTNVSPTTIPAGASTSSLDHLGVNATNGINDDTFSYDVFLSIDDVISPTDTLLSNQAYSWNYGAVESVRVDSANVTIPDDTPPGTYWIGVRYADVTDGDSGNNDSSDWDAQQITVTQDADPPSPDPMTFATNPSAPTPGEIQMVATTASDPSGGVEYFFEVSSPTGGTGGTDSDWLSSPSYTDSGLQDLHEYCYQVRARDTHGNMTAYSPEQCTTTPTLRTCDGKTVTILGTAAGDTLIGTSGPDVIAGLGGGDVIEGRGGDDTICGGNGPDVLRGGNGADRVFGQGGDDTLYGQGGADQLFGGNAQDIIYGGNGDDSLSGQNGNDELYGQGGNDTLAGNLASDICSGGAGASDSASASCETILSVP